jgi:hypothetical protein
LNHPCGFSDFLGDGAEICVLPDLTNACRTGVWSKFPALRPIADSDICGARSLMAAKHV